MADFIHKPPEGDCQCCWDDLGPETYVEYKTDEKSLWLASGFCENCIKHLLSTQYNNYTNGLAKSTCKAEQRRMLEKGPPINLCDKTALPCPNDGEVYMLWFMSDQQEHSAKLENSLIGEERQAYWEEQKQFYIVDEVEGEEDGEGGQAQVPGTS